MDIYSLHEGEIDKIRAKPLFFFFYLVLSAAERTLYSSNINGELKRGAAVAAGDKPLLYNKGDGNNKIEGEWLV